jgi:hypothetical protein
VYFFVETKGLTLEEVDDIFETKNSRKASMAVKKTKYATFIGADGVKKR